MSQRHIFLLERPVCILEFTYSAMRARLQAYIKDHFSVIAVIVFVFLAGVASGFSMIKTMYHEEAAQLLRSLPSILRTSGVPWLECFLLSLFSHVFICGLLLLSGLWLPTAPLWLAGILLRGMLLGAAIGACISAWPLSTSIILLILLQMEAAVLLPPLLRLAVLAQTQISEKCKQKLGVTQLSTSLLDYTVFFLKGALGLIPTILFQSVLTPAILALFC